VAQPLYPFRQVIDEHENLSGYFIGSCFFRRKKVEAATFSMDQCSVTFSPNGGTTQALVAYIGTAKTSIRLLAYNFTSTEVANALVLAHRRGVDVQLVLDKSVPTERNSVLPIIQRDDIPFRIDHAHAIAHNKVIIIDGAWVETGSFNYSDNAEHHNGENALICHSPDAYKLYRTDWEKHWLHSLVLTNH
jgi:phosphatidylserine/phosphatidylglycerophosphate/cardiolipin synthase-like enzyme